MRTILLTNDDGIAAPGLAALFRTCGELGRCIVVAPAAASSGSSHTCTTHDPIRVTRETDDWYAVAGTPVDCARVGLTHVAPNADILISGINNGGNLGADLYISGTAAAAREAALLGYRGIALSQYVRPDLNVDWEATSRRAQTVLQQLLDMQESAVEHFWNVNFPHISPTDPEPATRFCGLDPGPLRVEFTVERQQSDRSLIATFSGDYHSRERQPGRDVDVCFGGEIAVTKVPLDFAKRDE
ncbi:MAG: 5'/3'-nucleotidase SurE [Planctomycetes bacterium]|nr:5'/3'-nucleotidase SurE [Planctomycetota bacterium]